MLLCKVQGTAHAINTKKGVDVAGMPRSLESQGDTSRMTLANTLTRRIWALLVSVLNKFDKLSTFAVVQLVLCALHDINK